MTERPQAMLNHVALVFGPGEREVARALFETVGFTVLDHDRWLIVHVDRETGDGVDNVLFASEPVPAQRKFEEALNSAIDGDPILTGALEHYREWKEAHPQVNFHFGASIKTYDDWQGRLERLRQAKVNHPLLAGRFKLKVLEKGDPDSLDIRSQLFIFTDILAVGPFALGLVMELQWTPDSPAGKMSHAELVAGVKIPDFDAME